MKKYTFEEMITELKNDQTLEFEGYNICPYVSSDKAIHIVEVDFGNLAIYERGEKIGLSPSVLESIVCSSEIYFTRKLSHDEKLIEKWSKVPENTPVESKDSESGRTEIFYFKHLNKEEFGTLFVISKYQDKTLPSHCRSIKLVGDTKWDTFD